MKWWISMSLLQLDDIIVWLFSNYLWVVIIAILFVCIFSCVYLIHQKKREGNTRKKSKYPDFEMDIRGT